jgi:carboxyl-terminal processing protease
MKKITLNTTYKSLLSLAFVACVTLSCSKDETPDPVIVENNLNLENYPIHDFIWKGLNYWYYWKDIVIDLDDSKKTDKTKYVKFLSEFNNPEELFNHLKIDEYDDFSWYIKDVDEQLKQFAGTNKSYGIRLGRSLFTKENGGVYIYIAYVIPNSPAHEAGLKRGDIIYKVDGTIMDSENYSVINNLFNNDSVTLGVGSFDSSTGELIANEKDIEITRIEFQATPIQHYSVINSSNKKIGYLVYNSFKYPFHGELNDVFTYFKTENVNELVIDLRYNGGGTVITAAFLASMINGQISKNSVFADLRYNTKRNNEEGSKYPFFDEVYLYNFDGSFDSRVSASRLSNIQTLYVLTSQSTASASEMIINGLRPYMNVITIGGTTTGKNEGSITVVDSPGSFNDTNNRNPNHTIGMQPIVFQIFNSNSENDYDNGFIPSVEIDEMDYAEEIKQFGDVNEPFLSAAIQMISGVSSKKDRIIPKKKVYIGPKIKEERFSKEMYLIPGH